MSDDSGNQGAPSDVPSQEHVRLFAALNKIIRWRIREELRGGRCSYCGDDADEFSGLVLFKFVFVWPRYERGELNNEFLKSVVHSVVVDHFRRCSRAPRVQVDTVPEVTVIDENGRRCRELEDKLERLKIELVTLRVRLLGVLVELRWPLQHCAKLRWVDGLSMTATAQELCVSTDSVKNLTRTAKNQSREHYEAKYGESLGAVLDRIATLRRAIELTESELRQRLDEEGLK